MAYGVPTYAATQPSSAMGMNEIVGVLKELYDGQKVQIMTYTKNPFLAMVKKKADFTGKLYPLPVVQDGNANAGGTFSTAQTNTTAAKIYEFMLQRVPGYQIAQIGHEAMLAAKMGDGSFIDGVKLVVDQAIQGAVNLLASGVFRGGTGTIGQVSTIGVVGTGVILLADPNSATQFQLGQVLQSAATDGGTPRAALGYVIAIGRSTGTVTVSASAGGAAGTPSGWVTGDYLLTQGNSNAVISGLPGWLVNPALISGSDSWFSVNRSADPTRLAGVYYNGALQSIEEALVDASSLTAREGGETDVCVTNFASYSSLIKSLGAKTTYTQLTTEVGSDKGPTAQIGFRGVMLDGAASQFRVFPDRNCTGFQAWLLDMSTWVLASAGEAPHIFDYDDGVQMLRMPTADSAELRVGYYAQLGCSAPVRNASVILGS